MASNETIGLLIDVQQRNSGELQKISAALTGMAAATIKAQKAAQVEASARKFSAMAAEVEREAKRSLATATKAATKETEAAAKASIQFGSALGSIHLTGINQGLELAKKAFRAFEAVVVAAVHRALEFRFSWDPARKTLENFSAKLLEAQARIGDMLIPALVGLSEGLTPVINGFLGWAGAQEKVVQAKIVDYVVDVAEVLVKGAAFGLQTVIKVWTGWNMLIGSARSILVRYGLAVEDLMIKVGLLSDVEGKSAEEREVTNQRMIDQADATTAKLVADYDTISAGIDDVRGSLLSGLEASRQFGKTYVDEAKRATTATAALEAAQKSLLDTMEKDMADAAVRSVAKTRELREREEADIAASRIQQIDGESEKVAFFRELGEKQRKEEKDRLKASVEEYESLGKSIFGTFTSAFSGVADGTKTLAEAFQQLGSSIVSMIISMAAEWAVAEGARAIASQAASNTVIAGRAGEAAAGAASSQAGIPIIGPALAIAAGAAMLAFVLGFAAGGSSEGPKGSVAPPGVSNGTVQKFASGGFVSGGIHGVDSVPALLMPGERVLNNRQAREYERGGNSGGGTTNFLMFTHSRAAFSKVYRDEFAPVTKRLTRNRVIKSG